MRKAVRDESGATAIEYGLIVALIAVGIMGSLVVTKTSLVSTYNTIGSDLGGASGTPQAAVPVPALFANRTLSSKASNTYPWGQTSTKYTYTDGSVAVFTTASNYRGSYYQSNVQLTDATTGITTTYTPAQTDANGNNYQPGYAVSTTYADGNQKTYTTYPTFDPAAQNATGTQYNYPDQSGGASTGSSAVTTAVSTFSPTINQYNAYKANP